MMFSASTRGFYLPELHGHGIPSDAVEIADDFYRSLLLGQSEGKVIDAGEDGMPYLTDPPPAPPIPIPDRVEMYQARAVLIARGLDERVEILIDEIDDPIQRKQVRNLWDKSPGVRRRSPVTQLLAQGLELSEDDLDELFVEAAQVE